MNTLLMELRYWPTRRDPNVSGPHETVSQVVDGMNDVILSIAARFGLDLLSVSHVFETNQGGSFSFVSTAICLLNGQTLQGVAKVLAAENNARINCFCDRHKLSVRVHKINYN